MATFERYFVSDPETHVEVKNSYYALLNNENVINSILNEFGLDTDHSHIVNGHVPVERKNGESPVKCNGKLLIIDGGFSRAYQDKTGTAGYTLISSSYGLRLVAHENSFLPNRRYRMRQISFLILILWKHIRADERSQRRI